MSPIPATASTSSMPIRVQCPQQLQLHVQQQQQLLLRGKNEPVSALLFEITSYSILITPLKHQTLRLHTASARMPWHSYPDHPSTLADIRADAARAQGYCASGEVGDAVAALYAGLFNSGRGVMERTGLRGRESVWGRQRRSWRPASACSGELLMLGCD